MVDEPEKLKDEAKYDLNNALMRAQKLQGLGLLDGYTLCSDYCLNVGPFLSPDQFSIFVTPYLREATQIIQKNGILYH